ncbi:unnamed protein product [Aphanomyces euteiches]
MAAYERYDVKCSALNDPSCLYLTEKDVYGVDERSNCHAAEGSTERRVQVHFIGFSENAELVTVYSLWNTQL